MDFLQVSGNKIVNAGGAEVRLRGTCVGGWMNMENFIDGYPGSEAMLRHTMTETLGKKRGAYFFEALLDRFFNIDDVAFIRSLGATVVRLPLNYRHFEDDERPFEYLEKGFERLDGILDACEAAGLYAILDMHAVPGWQNPHWHSDNPSGVSLFWKHPHFQERLRGLWREFACRYAGREVVAGYELMNEPATNLLWGDLPHRAGPHFRPDWEAMNRVYRELTAAIRRFDPRHIIFLEGDRYGQLFSGLEPPFADNLVYSCHNYTAAGFGPGPYPGPFKKTRNDETGSSPDFWDKAAQERLFGESEGAVFARKHGVPLWCGEFGSQYNTGPEDMPYRVAAMNDQLAVLNEWGAHWTTWTYKDMGVMGWVCVDPRSDYSILTYDIQRKKAALGAENFVGWFTPGEGKAKNRALAETIAALAPIKGTDAGGYTAGLSLLTLTGFAAACLQPAYCALFKGMKEKDLDRFLSAFTLENCLINEPYLAVLAKRLASDL